MGLNLLYTVALFCSYRWLDFYEEILYCYCEHSAWYLYDSIVDAVLIRLSGTLVSSSFMFYYWCLFFYREIPKRSQPIVARLCHIIGSMAYFYVRKQLMLSAHLVIAVLFVCLSVRLSVTQVDQSKTVQARIAKSSPLAAWKTLVSGTVKLLHKFEGSHPEQEC